MRYLHTMIRVRDLDQSVDFYRNKHSDEIDSTNQQLSRKAELEHRAVKDGIEHMWKLIQKEAFKK